MCKPGSLDRPDGQRFTPAAPQAVVWAMAPGQNPPQGGQGSVQCLLLRRGQPARPLSAGVWRRKTQLSSMKLQGVGHGAARGAEGKAPGGACALER